MILATTTGDIGALFTNKADCVRAYAKTPFKHLDMNFYRDFQIGAGLMKDNWMDDICAAADAARECGLDFVQAHAPDINISVCDGEAGRLCMKRCIEACGKLGIHRVVMHTSIDRAVPYPAGEKEYFRLNRDFIASLYPEMEKYDVSVLVENSTVINMQGAYFFMTAAEMNAFIDFCGHPLVGACWDVGHANMEKADQYKEIRELGANLRAVHMQDNFGWGDIHIAPLMGNTDFDAILRALRDIRFPGTFTFEADNLLPVRKDAKIKPSLESKLLAETLLYSIGRDLLSPYGLLEE